VPVKYLKEWFDELDKKLSDHDKQVAKRILIEIHHRIYTLLSVGLGYLTLSGWLIHSAVGRASASNSPVAWAAILPTPCIYWMNLLSGCIQEIHKPDQSIKRAS
jgi:hypothetical protein